MSTDIVEMHTELFTAISGIDEKLDSRLDGKSAGKRALINGFVEAQEDTINKVADPFIVNLGNLEPEAQIGVYRGILAKLKDAFDEQTTAAVEKMVEEMPKVEPLITEDEVEPLQKTRSELYQQIKMIVNLGKQFGAGELKMPKTRRGSTGKRGPRKMNLMVWAINGEEVPTDTMLKDLAVLLGFEKSKDFTAFLKKQGVDTTNPENDVIEVTLEDSRVLTGWIPDEDENEDREEDDADENCEAEETE